MAIPVLERFLLTCFACRICTFTNKPGISTFSAHLIPNQLPDLITN